MKDLSAPEPVGTALWLRPISMPAACKYSDY